MQNSVTVSVHPRVQSNAFTSVRWIMTALKLSIYRWLDSATLSQLAFPDESNPNFPREKFQWDNKAVKCKCKKNENKKEEEEEKFLLIQGSL